MTRGACGEGPRPHSSSGLRFFNRHTTIDPRALASPRIVSWLATFVMFECGICAKSYATQSSLTCHAHNHESAGRHACPTCGIGFRRRDLLARHEKIHISDEGPVEQDRRRCHTACECPRFTVARPDRMTDLVRRSSMPKKSQ